MNPAALFLAVYIFFLWKRYLVVDGSKTEITQAKNHAVFLSPDATDAAEGTVMKGTLLDWTGN